MRYPSGPKPSWLEGLSEFLPALPFVALLLLPAWAMEMVVAVAMARSATVAATLVAAAVVSSSVALILTGLRGPSLHALPDLRESLMALAVPARSLPVAVKDSQFSR